jgi:hypothetical protein
MCGKGKQAMKMDDVKRNIKLDTWGLLACFLLKFPLAHTAINLKIDSILPTFPGNYTRHSHALLSSSHTSTTKPQTARNRDNPWPARKRQDN